MAESCVDIKGDERLKGYLHGFNNLEDVRPDLITTMRITLPLFKLLVWSFYSETTFEIRSNYF